MKKITILCAALVMSGMVGSVRAFGCMNIFTTMMTPSSCAAASGKLVGYSSGRYFDFFVEAKRTFFLLSRQHPVACAGFLAVFIIVALRSSSKIVQSKNAVIVVCSSIVSTLAFRLYKAMYKKKLMKADVFEKLLSRLIITCDQAERMVLQAAQKGVKESRELFDARMKDVHSESEATYSDDSTSQSKRHAVSLYAKQRAELLTAGIVEVAPGDVHRAVARESQAYALLDKKTQYSLAEVFALCAVARAKAKVCIVRIVLGAERERAHELPNMVALKASELEDLSFNSSGADGQHNQDGLGTLEQIVDSYLAELPWIRREELFWTEAVQERFEKELHVAEAVLRDLLVQEHLVQENH